MASWHFHSLVFQNYIDRTDVPLEHLPLFHLGCFAPDLVREQPLKKITHLGVGFMKFPLYFQIGKFKKNISYQHITDESEKWFYRGYLLHLLTDSVWVKCCMYPFVVRLLLSKEKLRDAGTSYYADMIEIDSYYRNLNHGSNPESASIKLLQEVEKPVFWPDTLSFGRTESVVKLLSETMGNSSKHLRLSFISPKNVERFISKAMRFEVD